MMFNHQLMRLLTLVVLFINVSAQYYRQGEIRLEGGSVHNEGRVEIYVNGEWGTVCHDWWNTNDAIVVCRQLGYRTSGALPFTRAYFGKGDGRIALDNVRCTSNEETLLTCLHRGLFVENCNHDQDAGVRCDDSERLVNITANVISTSNAMTTVSVSWELQNTTLDEPWLFEVECFNDFHKVTPLGFVHNRSYTTQIVGLVSPTSYNCCVSAVYGVYVTSLRTICTPVDIPLPTVTEVTSLPVSIIFASNTSTANTVGGVLGFMIIVLLIVLALLGAAVLYLFVILKRKHKAERTPRDSNVGGNLSLKTNQSYIKTSSCTTFSEAKAQTVNSGASREGGSHEYGTLEIEYETLDSRRIRQPERSMVNVSERYEFAEIHSDGVTEAMNYEVPADLHAQVDNEDYSHLTH